MNRRIWLEYIPHRPPFLFVDEVIEIGSDAIKTVFRADPALPFFAGHFPGMPVMPGALLCECCFQAGAVLMGHRNGEGPMLNAESGSVGCSPAPPLPDGSGSDAPPRRSVPVVTRILEAKFKRVVRPEDVLTIDVSLDEEMGGAFFMTGKVNVGGETALRCKFAVTQVEGQEEPMSMMGNRPSASQGEMPTCPS